MPRLARLRRCAVAASILACAATAGSCGDEPSGPSDRIPIVMDQLREAFDAGDVVAVCRLMAPRAPCAPTVRLLLDRRPGDASDARSGDRTVLEVDARRRRAGAIVKFHRHVPGRLRFVEDDGEWKLADHRLRPVRARSRWRAARTPPERFDVARVRGGRRAPCPQITAVGNSGAAPVEGGCRFRARSKAVDLLMLTAFGDFTIARCSMSYALHLDSGLGTILADNIRFSGPPLCRRSRRCAHGETGLTYPWQGSKLRGPFELPLQIQLDICVNTPVGRSRGMLHLQVVAAGRSLALQTYDYPVGESSIQLRGRWTLGPGTFELRPVAD